MKFLPILFIVFLICGCKKEDKKSTDNSIRSFTIQHSLNSFLKDDVTGSFSGDTITFTLPSDTVGKVLIPTIVAADGATVTPANKVKVMFTQPIPYYVTAASGAVKRYIVVCKTKASDKDILGFSFLKSNNPNLSVDVFAVISKDTIKIRVPENYADLTPSITCSNGAHITGDVSKGSFAASRKYTVTAADGTVKSYITALSVISAPQLKNFKINGADCAYDSPTKTFYYPVPLNTALNTYTVSFNADSAKF